MSYILKDFKSISGHGFFKGVEGRRGRFLKKIGFLIKPNFRSNYPQNRGSLSFEIAIFTIGVMPWLFFIIDM